MAEVIRMPKMSDTMEEGVISSWLVKVGDTVASGDVLAEVETDKATMELENYEDGVILYLAIAEKAAVPIDSIIAIIGENGEDFEHLLSSGAEPDGSAQAPEKPEVKLSTPTAAIDTSAIAATVIKMPKMSDTMEEGVISSWLVKVGDTVSSGDILAEVETDKATMELESYEDGTILYLAVEPGGAVPINSVIAIVGDPATDYQPLLEREIQINQQPAAAPPVSAPETTSPAPTTENKKQITVPENNDSSRIKISPLARKLASEKGYDIDTIKGTGENGRIVKRDIEAHIPQPIQQQAPVQIPKLLAEESFTEEPISQMRKTIAKRLSESKFTAPHFYLTMKIDMDKSIEARKSMNEISTIKISFNDIVIRAVAAALRKHPKVNAAWLEDKVQYAQHIHIGVAVAVDEGLLVPVVRFADSKSLSAISSEVKELGKKARQKKLQPSEWEGNTFVVSNLGMFGVEEFTAIINPPNACILAVGAIEQVPVVRDGEIKPGNVMKITLCCDHRVVDGAVGSAFLQTLKSLLENPVTILV